MSAFCSICFQVPAFPEWFNIVYDSAGGEDIIVYTYKLEADLAAGDLQILV